MNCPICDKEILEEDRTWTANEVRYHSYCYCKNMKDALEEIVAESKSIQYVGNIKNTAERALSGKSVSHHHSGT